MKGLAATLVIGLLACALSQRADEQSKQVLADKFVPIAVIEPKMAEHVQSLLEGNRIPTVIEGSLVYGVSVPPARKDRAIRVLRADAANHGYWVKF
jgi:hypothetical protein